MTTSERMPRSDADKRQSAGLYIHIPFCMRKCGYCDFNSVACADYDIHRRYCEALKKEMQIVAERQDTPMHIDSVFFGGGTPSLPDSSLICDLLDSARALFDIDEGSEITIEANPGIVDEAKTASYMEHGINRLSLGVQAFDDGVLAGMGRIHDAQTAEDAIRMIRRAGCDNINIDLMFAVPGQSMETWRETLQKAADLHPEHISMYGLQIEEGTPFGRMVALSEMIPVSDEEDRAMYHEGLEMLSRAGYEHYEISNLAAGGRQCRHNIKYWTMMPYVGLGAGAHSYTDGIRYSNHSDIERYIQIYSGVRSERHVFGSKPADIYEYYHENTRWDDISEYMFTGLRMMQGIDMADFADRFGADIWDVYRDEEREIRAHLDAHLLELRDGRLRLTGQGIDISNRVMATFV